MNRIGRWKWQLLLLIVGLMGLAAIAGSWAAPPAESVPSPGTTLEPSPQIPPSPAPIPMSPSAGQRSSGELRAAPQPAPSSAAASAPAPVDPGNGRQPIPKTSVDPPQPTPPAPLVESALAPPPSIPTAAASSSKDDREEESDSIQARVGANEGDGDEVELTEYTWQDGDRTLTVILQNDLEIKAAATKDALANAPGGSVVKSPQARGVGDSVDSGESPLPVFKSQSGSLMTLPGGVLLVLDPDWSETEVNSFFSTNDIKRSDAEALSYIENGYFIQTEPGFPSLELANSLAALEGVLLSSPNWWTEVTIK